jgi:hypothetical protein
VLQLTATHIRAPADGVDLGQVLLNGGWGAWQRWYVAVLLSHPEQLSWHRLDAALMDMLFSIVLWSFVISVAYMPCHLACCS